MTDADSAGLDAFQAQRPYLRAVAYRLMGSFADAEDVLQDAWLRWTAADRSRVDDARAYLTTVVTRICYDLLGAVRVRRESYHGEWLPEPAVSETQAPTPAERAEVGEMVSLGMLAVMEQLTPAERVAFVLHDLFAVGFDEIAAVLDRSPEAARQAASRARRRVRGGHRRRAVDAARHRDAVRAFAAAAETGDIQGLLAVLDPGVVWHSDGGGIVTAGVRPVLGADKVSRLVAGLAAKWLHPRDAAVLRLAEVNGELGVVFHAQGRIAGVFAFTVADGRIREAYAVVNPEKLAHLL